MTPNLTAKLNSGASIPLVGLGCWMGAVTTPDSKENEETLKMVRSALQAGYTHFDTASGYGNEEAVGKAIRESGVPRKELFVTTKLQGTDAGRVAEAFETSLQLLDIDYIDLYLIHWPMAKDPVTMKVLAPTESPTVSDVWAQMEKLLATGKVKSIGVSNFATNTLTQLLSTAKVIPAVNQIEMHPYLPNTETFDFCAKNGIHVTAYCPLGQSDSPILSDPVVVAIAKKHKKTTGQVVLSWAVQRGVSVVPKSSSPTRQVNNLAVFELSQDEFESINSLHLTEGKNRSLCRYGGGYSEPGKLYGWTFEDLGWDPKWFASHY